MRSSPGRLTRWWHGLPTRARVAAAGVLVVAVVLAVVLPLALGGGTPAGRQVSPLTGLKGGSGRIVAVKIDNFAQARPQTGVEAADVVYAIEVEGGLSRFLAVYDTAHLPSGGTVGPVRSARESDLQVLRQYGKVDFAYSGAQTRFLPVLDAADIVNCSPRQAGSLYFRGRGRPAPFNEFLRLPDAPRECPGSAAAKDIGFRFGPAPRGGVPADSFGARMPAASFTFTWSPDEGEYLVSVDGAPARTTDAGRLAAPTVVIQRVAETTSPLGLRDSSGALSPFAPTVGSGTAVVLRDGRAYQGTWSRPKEGDGTVFTYQGRRMPFRPGRVWVVLEPR